MATLPSLSAVPSDAPDMPADAIEVGVVVGPWGIKGAFKVHAHATDPQALFSSRRWFLQPPASQGPRRPALPLLLRVTQAREQGGVVVATAQEVADRAAAESLHGARVFVARSSFPTAGDDEYYWVDLIGLSVLNREGVTLGTVVDLIDTGAHSVLRVCRPNVAPDSTAELAERLIPFVAAYIDSVDPAARLIRVDWGLDY